MKLLKICPVCGWDKLIQPPYNIYNEPSYEICFCCGFEFGFTDANSGYSFIEWRKKWIESSYKFYFPKNHIPEDWGQDMAIKQLENVQQVNYCPRLHKKS
ncbi:hypothetical protein [Maribellus mangrovi]|uniref:hypothetical protein n=1 Tax=Maribellus mangrovi TaxID=3133146 RepID=UPI0030EDC2C9